MVVQGLVTSALIAVFFRWMFGGDENWRTLRKLSVRHRYRVQKLARSEAMVPEPERRLAEASAHLQWKVLTKVDYRIWLSACAVILIAFSLGALFSGEEHLGRELTFTAVLTVGWTLMTLSTIRQRRQLIRTAELNSWPLHPPP